MLFLGSGLGSSWSAFVPSLRGPAEDLRMASEGCLSVLDVEEADYIFLVKKDYVLGVWALGEAQDTSSRRFASGGMGMGWFPGCFPFH